MTTPKAQQWLQSGIGVIEAQDFASCDPLVINGANVEAAYQAAIDNPVSGAKRPFGFTGATIDVKTPEVWAERPSSHSTPRPCVTTNPAFANSV